MKPKKDQHKVGIRAKPRGQQMEQPALKIKIARMKETPAVLGRRKVANKMAADKSAQNIGGAAVTPRTSSPSTPAMTGGVRKGESGGETVFKARQKKAVPAERAGIDLQPAKITSMEQQNFSKDSPGRVSGRIRAIVRPAFILAMLSLLVISTGRNATSVAQKLPAKKTPILVGVVSKADAPEGSPQNNLDPVVLLVNGTLKQPYAEYNEAAQKKFASDYFAPGKKYRVTFGGGEVGTATVNSSGMGCNTLHASATVDDNGKVPAHLSALVTNSETLGKKASARRTPSMEERAAVMKVVNQIYRSHATSPALLRTLKTTNLTATDLDGDGRFELIGSFVIETKAKQRKDLLLIAAPQGLRGAPGEAISPTDVSYKAALVHFQAYKLPPEQFDSAVDFVDQLDLDGDGIAEVFVQEHGFDAYGYSIYKKSRGRWRQVYTTTGDAC